jgi:CubicO group peptidase (beta-lactamase class C family)
MYSNQIGDIPDDVLGKGWRFGYGFRILVDRDAAKTPMSNGTVRWEGAYGHSWFVDPRERLSVVALTNTTWEGMVGKFAVDVTKAVYA